MIDTINKIFNQMSDTKDFPELHITKPLKNGGVSYFCYDIKAFSYGFNKTNQYIEFITDDLLNYDLSIFAYETKATGTRIYLYPDTNQGKLYDLFSYINDKCDNSTTVDFECCSRFKECSAAKRCINNTISDGVPLGLNCGYRKILNKGKVYY